MLEDIAAYVRAGLEALSSQRPEDAAGAFAARATGLAEQLTAFASGFLEWSTEARASLMHELKDMVSRQVEGMGLATREDVEALNARVDRLEGKAPAAAGKGRSGRGHGRAAAPTTKGAGRATASRSGTTKGAGRSTAKRSGSRASAASTAKRSGSRGATLRSSGGGSGARTRSTSSPARE